MEWFCVCGIWTRVYTDIESWPSSVEFSRFTVVVLPDIFTLDHTVVVKLPLFDSLPLYTIGFQ